MCSPLLAFDAWLLSSQGYHVCQDLLNEDEVGRLREHAMAVVAGEYETNRPPMNCNPADPQNPTKPHPQLLLSAPMHQVGLVYCLTTSQWTLAGNGAVDSQGSVSRHLATLG